MANHLPDTDVRLTEDRPPGIPRWVKVSGIIVIVLILLVVVVLVTGLGGEHGPSRHIPSGDTGVDTPPASVTESDDAGGHTPPVEHSTQQP